MLAARLQGATLAEVGAQHGVSKERVRQILRGVMRPGDDALIERARVRRRERERAADERRREAECPTRRCAVCRGAMPACKAGRTCSSDCARAWAVVRRHLDPDAHHRHRLVQARRILRDPDAHKPSSVAWAERMLSDDPPPPNRRFVLEGSEAARVLAELGR